MHVYAVTSDSLPDKNTGVGCRALLQGIFLIQGSNLRLLCSRQIIYVLSHQGSLEAHVVQGKEKSKSLDCGGCSLRDHSEDLGVFLH